MSNGIKFDPSNITVADVVKVYTGRPGCMCGCKGKYRINPAYREAVQADRGSHVTDDEVSLRSCQQAVARLERNADQVRTYERLDNKSCHIETDTNNFTVYLRPSLGRKGQVALAAQTQ